MAEARSRKSKSRSSGSKSASGARSKRGGSATAAQGVQGAGGARKSAAKTRSLSRQGGRGAGSNARSGGAKSAAGRTSASRKSAPRKSAARKGGESRASAGGRGLAKKVARRGKTDALSLLKQDHETVNEMFRKYDRMKGGDERKNELRDRIIEEVRVHAQMEEEIFYSALENALDEGGKEMDLIHEAHVEHDTVKWLIEQIEGAQGDEDKTDACVKVMGEYIRHHVEEEEGQIFKAAKKARVDLEELGRRMDARKRELKGEPPADADSMAEGGLQVMEPAQMASAPTRH